MDKSCSIIVTLLGLTLGSQTKAGEVTHRAATDGAPRTLENLLTPPSTSEAISQEPAIQQPSRQEMSLPTASEIDSAITLVREAFPSDFANAQKQPRTTAQTLQRLAWQTEDPARRYALLCESERVATEAGLVREVIVYTTHRIDCFAIDPFPTLLDALQRVAADDERAPEAHQYVVAFARDAMQAERFAECDEAIRLALRLAKNVERSEKAAAAKLRRQSRGTARPTAAKWPDMIATSLSLQKAYLARKLAFDDYEKIREQLLAQPDDLRARTRAGEYLCYYKNDWLEGLPLLASGEPTDLRSVSERELKAADDCPPTETVEIANAWWRLAENESTSPFHREAMRLHAKSLYRSVAQRLVDPVDKAIAERRGDASP